MVQLAQVRQRAGNVVPALVRRDCPAAVPSARWCPAGAPSGLRCARRRRRPRQPGPPRPRGAAGPPAPPPPAALPTSTRKRGARRRATRSAARSKPACDLRARVHRHAETGAAGLAAVHRDDEIVTAALAIARVEIRTADKHPILDRDGMQFASAHAEEGEFRRRFLVGDDGKTVALAPRLPQALDWRMQETLP